MTTGAVVQRIQIVAEQHLSISEDELERALNRAWVETGLIGKTPVRGDKFEFLRRLRKQLADRGKQLADRASAEVHSISVLNGIIAADVVKWASEHDIPADKYEYPIGLLVAWVTLAAFDKTKGGPPDLSSDTKKQ